MPKNSTDVITLASETQVSCLRVLCEQSESVKKRCGHWERLGVSICSSFSSVIMKVLSQAVLLRLRRQSSLMTAVGCQQCSYLKMILPVYSTCSRGAFSTPLGLERIVSALTLKKKKNCLNLTVLFNLLAAIVGFSADVQRLCRKHQRTAVAGQSGPT